MNTEKAYWAIREGCKHRYEVELDMEGHYTEERCRFPRISKQALAEYERTDPFETDSEQLRWLKLSEKVANMSKPLCNLKNCPIVNEMSFEPKPKVIKPTKKPAISSSKVSKSKPLATDE